MQRRLIVNLFCTPWLARFKADQTGNIAMIFALSLVMIVVGVGSAMDLGRAYNARQKLYQTAVLACQYASQSSIWTLYSSESPTSYATTVQTFITTNLKSQGVQYTQTTTTPLTYSSSGPTSVTLSANVPTTLMQVIKITQMPVKATVGCRTPILSTGTTPGSVAAGTYLLQEGFEAKTCSQTTCWTMPNGTTVDYTNRGSITLNNSFTATVAYTGSTNTQWYIMGYCLEVDAVGQILSSVPQGTHEAELDCDNGVGTAGNSSISTKTYLAAGNYELRYNYAGRIDYVDYDPVYLCGSAASDLSWANDTNATADTTTNVLRTNQINVYLDLNTNGQPPTHTTLVGSQTLAGSNLIDMCVYSDGWIQRSVRITVTTPGNYWLSFAADGTSDSFGGQIDNIMLCADTCSGSLQDNFPSSWDASTSSGITLFEDTFESPTYSGSPYDNSGNIYYSDGTSGSSSGWPSQTASGWAMGSSNELPYWTVSSSNTQGCPQGKQCVELGWTANSFISRPFLLDPGYYKVSYDYVSEISFSSLSGAYCGSTPSAANITTLTSAASAYGTIRYINVTTGAKTSLATNIVGVFMAHAQLASTPNYNSTFGSTTQYTNPDGTTSTTPTAAPNSVSLSSYNSAQNNPLLDICGYAASPQQRTSYILIQKPAYYWLTLSALDSNGYGGWVDDVKLTALGSPYMSSPPSSYVTIPVPSPLPSSETSFTGFTITADPLEPPAATQ